MSILDVSSKQAQGKGKPDQHIRLTTSLVAALWQRTDRKGNVRIAWSIDRHNEADPHTPFRMCDEKDVLELPHFAGRLAMAFAKKESLPIWLRKKLAQLASAMAQVDELMLKNMNGEDKEDSSNEKELLSFEV